MAPNWQSWNTMFFSNRLWIPVNWPSKWFYEVAYCLRFPCTNLYSLNFDWVLVLSKCALALFQDSKHSLFYTLYTWAKNSRPYHRSCFKNFKLWHSTCNALIYSDIQIGLTIIAFFRKFKFKRITKNSRLNLFQKESLILNLNKLFCRVQG